MLRIGLTGGIGAGKSTVAKSLVGHGAVLVDSDVIAREVVAPGTPGLAALVAAFGTGIVAPDGALDRPALAAKAFADDAARATLNGIVHPLVGRRTAELIAAAPPNGIVVQDIPLLVENGLAPLFQLVLVVWADPEDRVQRLVRRGLTEADARARIAAQATDEQRRAVADVWLDNSGAPGAMDPEVDRLWHERLMPFARNIETGTAVTASDAVVAADPQWATQAQRLVARLRVVCGANATAITHVGPTAVPQPAVDRIDLDIAATDPAALTEPLTSAGFPPVGTGVFGNADPARPVAITVRAVSAS